MLCYDLLGHINLLDVRVAFASHRLDRGCSAFDDRRACMLLLVAILEHKGLKKRAPDEDMK